MRDGFSVGSRGGGGRATEEQSKPLILRFGSAKIRERNAVTRCATGEQSKPLVLHFGSAKIREGTAFAAGCPLMVSTAFSAVCPLVARMLLLASTAFAAGCPSIVSTALSAVFPLVVRMVSMAFAAGCPLKLLFVPDPAVAVRRLMLPALVLPMSRRCFVDIVFRCLLPLGSLDLYV